MTPKRKKVPEKYRSWLSTPRLELKPLLNLARGCDPTGGDPPDWPPEGEWLAIWKQLKMAIDLGDLPTPMHVMPNLPIRWANSTTITDLELFWGFLADQPRNGCWDDLRWLCPQWGDECGRTLPSPQEAAKTLPTVASAARKRGSGGSPPKYDWDDLIAHLLFVANSPDRLPDSQAKIERLAMNWFIDKFGEGPAESTIRERIKRYCHLVLEKTER